MQLQRPLDVWNQRAEKSSGLLIEWCALVQGDPEAFYECMPTIDRTGRRVKLLDQFKQMRRCMHVVGDCVRAIGERRSVSD